MSNPRTLDIAPEILALLTDSSGGPDARVWPEAARPDLPKAGVRTVRVSRGVSALLSAPENGASRVTEILPGESFAILEDRDGWVWGQSVVDGYLGYVAKASLADIDDISANSTHRVAVPLAHLYESPDVKSSPRALLPMCSRLRLTGEREHGFAEAVVAGIRGWITVSHVRAFDDHVPDPVETAVSFLGAPYLWGGRSALGIDCSGLVQVSLAMSGVAVPRDTDMQERIIGVACSKEELRRGDLVFFPGHVGIMVDSEAIVHANATHMAVVIEPLADLVGRLRGEHPQPVTSVRRPQ